MADHRDIPDEVVKRAQQYDHEHWRADRNGEWGGSWGSVPADQVRRLIGGALEEWRERGLVLVQVTEEPRPAAFFDEYDLAAIGLHEDGSEEE